MKRKRLNELRVVHFKRFVRKGYAAFNSMHKVVNIGVVTFGVIASFNASSAEAQSASNEQTQQKVMEQELEEVMVTASRIETPMNQTAKLVTVITKEQVQRAPVQSIQDLLVYAANIDVIQRGGHGVQADISIRGGSIDQTAILLNGINITNSHTGHYSFDIPINLSDIERIEIIQGSSALIYGVGAFSGGINIITKKQADTKLYANLEAGMHALRGAEVRGTLQTGIVSNTLSIGNSASDGYVANSDYNIYNVLWQSRLNLPGTSKMDLQLGYNDKKYGANTFYSPRFPNQYDKTRTYVGTLKGEFGTTLKFIPIIYWNRHHDNFELERGTDFGRNFHRNDTYGSNLIFAYKSKLGNTSMGLEMRKEEIISSVLGKPMNNPFGNYKKHDDRTNTSLSFEHTVSIEKLVLSAGALMNHNTLLSGEYKFYPSLSASYRPHEQLKVTSSWSKSTRMPTFTDLYYSTETHTANETLKPEKSETLDLNVKYRNSYMTAYVTGFMLWGRDMIDWIKTNPEDTKWASWNLSKVNTAGVEVGAKLYTVNVLPALGDASFLSVDYARMHQTFDTKGFISIYALNYLRDKFTAQFSHQLFNGFTVAWFFRYQKRMGTYEKYENKVKVGDEPFPAFSTLDLKLNYQYKQFNFNLTLNNIYDTHYFDRGSIPQSGFWLIGGVSYVLK